MRDLERMLDAKDMEILLNLQKNPLATLSQISQQINLSVSNTSARLKRLEQTKRIYQGVHADLNTSALELEIYDFFFSVQQKQHLIYLEEKFSHRHPYVLFRNRITGKENGLFLQFRAPQSTLELIIETVTILQDKGIITDYQYLPREPKKKALRVKSALQYWSPTKKTWDFDWTRWKESYENAKSTPPPDREISHSILKELSDLDVKLLAELSLDARKKNVEMIQDLGLKPVSGLAQKVSRRVRFLKEKAIEDYRVFLHWTSFDLYQSVAIKGNCKSAISNKIYNHLDVHNNEGERLQFPFMSLYYLMSDGFFWYVRAPPNHLSKFLDFVWGACPNFELYLFDYQTSQIYGLWAETFDSENHSWKKDRAYMVERVLEDLI